MDSDQKNEVNSGLESAALEDEAPQKQNVIGPFKVLLVGDAAVGKTSILRSYTDDDFSCNYVSTIGIDFRRKMVHLGNQKYVKLQVWDTAGQERFRGLVNSYFRGCDAVIFVYDVTDRNSFQNTEKWINTVKKACELNSVSELTQTLQCMMVGNKIDLEHGREVSRSEGRKFAESLNMDLFETSAKNFQQIAELFTSLCEALWVDWETKWAESNAEKENTITTDDTFNSRMDIVRVDDALEVKEMKVGQKYACCGIVS